MKLRFFFAGCFILACSLFPFAQTAPDAEDESNGEDTPYDELAVLTRAIQLIRQDYYDEKKTNFKELAYSALRGMLQDLDPHSQFMAPSDFEEMQDDTNSAFGGLGLVVSTRDGTLTIVTPMEDTPGSRAGILPGDQILKINGESTEKLDLVQAIKQLRGEPGTKLNLTIVRPSTREIKDYMLTREIIKVPSVTDAHVLEGPAAEGFPIGYVRITQFNKPTADELDQALSKLEKEGIQALILDVRYNPGGLLDSARDVCGLFLPVNELVVYTKGRTPSQDKSYRTLDQGRSRRKYPLAILANGGSASGAEIVAGALKDLQRAVVVGETTFGKGSVQSVIQLPDGSAMRLTTARYFTPSKQVIHEKGVTPTIRATLTPDQERLLQFQRREEALTEKEKAELANFRDTQLERATDALKGMLIATARASDTKKAAPAKKP